MNAVHMQSKQIKKVKRQSKKNTKKTGEFEEERQRSLFELSKNISSALAIVSETCTRLNCLIVKVSSLY